MLMEESVCCVVVIQMIINYELGLAKNENLLQGVFIIEELIELVEEVVFLEFDCIIEWGGVLGVMEIMYQCGKIQDESFYYEMFKYMGEMLIIGVNIFFNKDGLFMVCLGEVICVIKDEKED